MKQRSRACPRGSLRGHSLSRCERGGGSVEHIILVGLVALATIGGYQRFGDAVGEKIACFGSRLNDGGCAPGGAPLGGAGRTAEPGAGAVEREAPDGATNQAYPGPAFVAGPGDGSAAHPSDVAQGALDDCYVMAPLGAIAAQDPAYIERLITDNHDGTYTVHLQPKDDVTVTAEFPTKDGKPVYAQTGDGGTEIWPMLIEKAYAQKVGGYDHVAGRGKLSQGLTLLTGQRSNVYKSANATFEKIYQQWRAGYAITATSLSASEAQSHPLYQDDRSPPLVADHGYYVTAMDPVAQTVTVQNPWGWEGKSTTLTWAEYQSALGYTMTNSIQGGRSGNAPGSGSN